MRRPVYVRALSEVERGGLEAGLRSGDAFVLRRCQILLGSARGERAPQLARALGCNDQTVRDVIAQFEREGVEGVLARRSNRPHHVKTKLDAAAGERLKELLHSSPRSFGKPKSIWTLALVAEVSFEQGLTKERVSDETVRVALKRLGVSWQRAKRWIASPDPEYRRKRGRESV
jgi:transposase